jgi:hypothetical protein
LHLGDDDDDRLTGGKTRAWVQVYVAGPGWVDFDPSSGMVGNQNLVRVAVVDEPREAIPLQGAWIGSASDHLAMKVTSRQRSRFSIPSGQSTSPNESFDSTMRVSQASLFLTPAALMPRAASGRGSVS